MTDDGGDTGMAVCKAAARSSCWRSAPSNRGSFWCVWCAGDNKDEGERLANALWSHSLRACCDSGEVALAMAEGDEVTWRG